MKGVHAASMSARTPDPYEELAIGIIQQAADDYRRLGEKLLRSGSAVEKRHISDKMKEISRFFLDDWYCVLSGIDNGADVLELMDQEVFGDDEGD